MSWARFLTRNIDRRLLDSPYAISSSIWLRLLVWAPLGVAAVVASVLGIEDERWLIALGLVGVAVLTGWVAFRTWKVAGAFSTRVSERRYRAVNRDEPHG